MEKGALKGDKICLQDPSWQIDQPFQTIGDLPTFPGEEALTKTSIMQHYDSIPKYLKLPAKLTLFSENPWNDAKKWKTNKMHMAPCFVKACRQKEEQKKFVAQSSGIVE